MDASRTVLIVDDEPLIRVVLVDLFEDAGFVVQNAESGDEAAKVIDRLSELDLLATDVRMAGDLDGIALALWTRERLPGTKIIIISGFVDVGSVPVAREFDAFLSKPFTPQALVNVAQQLLQAA